MPVTTYASRTTLDPIFKDIYEPRIRAQYYKQTPVAMRVKKRTDPEDFVGKQAKVLAHVGWSESVGARGEGDDLPGAYYPETAQLLVDVKYNYGRLKVTRPTMKASRNSAGAWAKALQFLMKDLKENVIFDTARQLTYGDGTGILAQVNGAVASGNATITVDNPGTRLIKKNMLVDFYDSGGTQKDAATPHRVSTVGSATQLTLAANLGANVADNDYVYRAGNRNNEIMGLAGIVDDGTRLASLQGITRSSSPWFKCNVMGNGGVNRALTLPLVDQAFMKGFNDGGGEYPTAIYSKGTLALVYMDLLRADRRYVKEMVLDGGWKALEYTGPGGTAPWIFDRMCRDNVVQFVHEPDLGYFILSPLEFVNEGEGILKWVSGKDEYEAYMAAYEQLCAFRCNNHTELRDLSES